VRIQVKVQVVRLVLRSTEGLRTQQLLQVFWHPLLCPLNISIILKLKMTPFLVVGRIDINRFASTYGVWITRWKSAAGPNSLYCWSSSSFSTEFSTRSWLPIPPWSLTQSIIAICINNGQGSLGCERLVRMSIWLEPTWSSTSITVSCGSHPRCSTPFPCVSKNENNTAEVYHWWRWHVTVANLLWI